MRQIEDLFAEAEGFEKLLLSETKAKRMREQWILGKLARRVNQTSTPVEHWTRAQHGDSRENADDFRVLMAGGAAFDLQIVEALDPRRRRGEEERKGERKPIPDELPSDEAFASLETSVKKKLLRQYATGAKLAIYVNLMTADWGDGAGVLGEAKARVARLIEVRVPKGLSEILLLSSNGEHVETLRLDNTKN